jgi:uncharacterized cofD-like protein
MKRIVVIGGGTGTYTVLSGLKEYNCILSAIVSTADDGGSTGVLRDELGVLPPGDIRQALVALSDEESILRELFSYRFSDGSLKGHSFGNLFLSALEKVTGSFDRAVLEAGKILAIHGQVIPVTRGDMHLRAETMDGVHIKGESAIDEYIWSDSSHIKSMSLAEPCELHPLAVQAIKQADLVVIAPGSIFTSIIPTVLVQGMQAALRTTKAPIVYIANLMTEKGQTGSYYVQDFACLIEQYLGLGVIDYVVYNSKAPDAPLLERYKKEMERIPVRLDRRRLKNLTYKLIGANVLSKKPPVLTSSSSDALAKTRTYIRHNPFKLADILYAIMVMKDAQKYLK